MVIAPSSNASAVRIREAALRLFSERGAVELSISELADAAGVARGTIYNNIEQPEALFTQLAADLAREMVARVEASMQGLDDPAARVATGLRLFVRRAHEEPHWGRFMVRFAASDELLRNMMDEPPVRDIVRGMETDRFRIDAGKHAALVAILTGTTLSTMHAVIAGRQAWREGGANAAELLLRAAGLTPAEARRVANADLPALAELAPRTRTKRSAP